MTKFISSPPPQWLTSGQVCELLNISRERLRLMLPDVDWTVYKVTNNTFLYSEDEVKEYKEKQNEI